MSDVVDYYAALGVERDATIDDIRRAYRKLARTYHPDINKDPAAEARFKEIAAANEVLSDPELRKKYDAFGADFRQVPDDVDPDEWARAQRTRGATWTPPAGSPQPDDAAFQEFLDDLLRERGRSTGGWGSIPGADQRASLSLSLDDAFHGGRRTLTMPGPSR